MPTESEAVRLLGELGLTEYEARCFVALSRVSTATAKEVSNLSGVPRSRVYDAVQRLHERGLVDVQQSDPREYQALETEEAIATLREQYDSVLADATDALGQLHRVQSPEDSGAWAISEAEHVSDRIEALVNEAQEDVYVLATDGRFARRGFPDVLGAAADRGASVTAEVASEGLREAIRDSVPSATVVATDMAAEPATVGEKWLGGIVMVDRRAVLISALDRSPRPDDPNESAIWATGSDHGLVVGLRQLLEARLRTLREAHAD